MKLNFNYLFHYLKKEKIAMDQNEFMFQIQSHPSYPSLLAISDTLSFFKINNLAARIENENLEHLPDTFIALLKKDANSFFTFVERVKIGFLYSENGKLINISNEAFEKMFQNVVLLAEKEEKEFKQKNTSNLFIHASIVLGLIYLTSIFTNNFSILSLVLVIFASIGVFLSIEAISHEFGIKTKFSEAVCTITTNSDCNAVLNSKKARFLEKFSFSDASITFFSSQLLGLLLFSISDQLKAFYNISTLALLISLPITFMSFYQQIIIAKKWCPICLSIIGLIYIELISLLVLNDFHFVLQFQSILNYSIALIGSYLVIGFVKNKVKENFDFKSKITENNRFKRKYSLFKMSLLASDKVKDKTNTLGNLILGNLEAKLKIIIISSPFCGHCKDSHKLIEKILELYSDKVCFDIRFNFNAEKSNEKSMQIHQKLIQIYFDEGQKSFMKALHNWFENNDESQLILKKTSQDYSKINELLCQQFTWNQENNINFTPAIIINNYTFPKEYDRNDLLYFINELEEDDDF